MDNDKNCNLKDAGRWGLNLETIKDLGQRLHGFWERFSSCFRTKRHDTSEQGLTYLKGLLLLPDRRTYKQIARCIESSDSDGQNLQQFMSDSPWSAPKVFDQIQTEIRQDERLQGGMLSLDESGDRRSGERSAGSARQYLGNPGKVDLGQVGVALGYFCPGDSASGRPAAWMMVDAELFLPEGWLAKTSKTERKRLHLPAEQEFKTKPAIGLELIDRAIANKLPFSRFSCDSLYGRNHDFRQGLDERHTPYLADIPANLKVYLDKPEVGLSARVEGGRRGRKPTRLKILNGVKPLEVRQIAQQADTVFETVDIRACERGRLVYPCAARPVWTLTGDGQARRETLFIRRESDGDLTYSLSNAPDETPPATLAQWRSERYYIERTFQDAKSEAGWDEFMAQKYRAWMHQAAFIALTLWFTVLTKLDWAGQCPADPQLLQQLQIEKLPALSMANIRLLLQAVMPLKQLTVEQAVDLVVSFQVLRAAATRSRLKKQRKINPP